MTSNRTVATPPRHPRTPRRPRRLRRAFAASLALIGVSTACANDIAVPEAPSTTRYDLGPMSIRGGLTQADSCDEVVEYLRANTAQSLQKSLADAEREAARARLYEREVSKYEDLAIESVEDVAAAPTIPATQESASRSGAGSFDAAGATAADMASDESATGTNNQEVGVDEADMIKTDGHRVVSLRNNELVVAELTEDGSAAIIGRVALRSDAHFESMFLVGNRVMVLGSAWVPSDEPAPADGASEYFDPGTSIAIIQEIEIGGTPRVVDEATVEGALVDGRMVDGVVRIVTSTAPPVTARLEAIEQRSWDAPADDWIEQRRASVAAQLDVLEATTAKDWLPASEDGTVLDPTCASVFLPEVYSGPQVMSVVTFADGADSMQATSVVAGSGATVYASTDRTFISTATWGDDGAEIMPTARIAFDSVAASPAWGGAGATSTQIHAFTTAGAANASYIGSTELEGSLLNQYSMSDDGEVLRVALTKGGWENSESGIVTIRPTEGEMPKVGEVWGLGRGETIQSVRYVGDTAYVVTFERTDPFYVVDLSDPAKPTTLGELKVPGFSSYLHPVSDTLVLGVGSDANNDGRVTGAKVSLYDVSNPTNPTEVDTWTDTNIGFNVSFDPHSFSWDAERGLAYMTYSSQCYDFERGCQYNNVEGGALVMAVGSNGLAERTRLTHVNRAATPLEVPATTVPETTVPETTAPETTIPDTAAPDTTAPDISVPESVPQPLAPATTSAAAVGQASDAAAAPLPIEPGPGWGPGDDPMSREIVPAITRAFPLGNLVVTWSLAGIGVYSADTYQLTGWAAF